MKVPGAHPPRSSTAAGLAAAGLVLCLYVLSALSHTFCDEVDEAVYVNLALSLRHGAYTSWDGGYGPLTDPLPGYPLLLCLPVWLLQPHWELVWIVGLLTSLAVVYLSWRLARRLLPSGAAWVAVALTALNPTLVRQSGLILPDVPYLGLTLFVLKDASDALPLLRLLLLAAAGGLAALVRPHGVLLLVALGAGIALRDGKRRASLFLAVGLAPPLLWALRNQLVGGASSGYGMNWLSQAGSLLGAKELLDHVTHIMATVLGEGLLGVSAVPLGLAAASGAGVIALSILGALRLGQGPHRPIAASIATYGALVLLLHATWEPVTPRYAIPLVPLLWILISAAVADLTPAKEPAPSRECLDRPAVPARPRPAPVLRGRATVPAAAILIALAVLADSKIASRGVRRPAMAEPATMAWIRDRTPTSARFASFACPLVHLFGRRKTNGPPLASDRDTWIAALLAKKIEYLHLFTFRPAGFFPAPASRLAQRQQSWIRSSPYFKEAYRNLEEQAIIYRLDHPDPDRYLAAYHALDQARMAARQAREPAAVRRKLTQAVGLEPGLASAWALLGQMETRPEVRLDLLRKAARADPSDESIREELRTCSPGVGSKRPGMPQ